MVSWVVTYFRRREWKYVSPRDQFFFNIHVHVFFIKIGPVGLRMEPLKFTKISFILIKSIDAIESFAIRNRTSLSTCNKPIQEVSFFWISRVLSDSQTNNIWLYLITYRNKRKLRREVPPLSSTSVRLITCTKTNSNPTITEWTNNKIYQNWLEKTAVHSYTRGGGPDDEPRRYMNSSMTYMI